MKKQTALKIVHLHNNMDKDDLRVIIELHDRIKKHQSLNSGLWVSDWRTASSHRWHGTTTAELARRLGLTIYQLETFISYINYPKVMKDLTVEYQVDLDNYRCDTDIDEALSWALTLLVDDYDLREHRLYDNEA